jgi:hypothetical protein
LGISVILGGREFGRESGSSSAGDWAGGKIFRVLGGKIFRAFILSFNYLNNEIKICSNVWCTI